MRPASDQFEALLESAPDAILLVAASGRIVLVNRRTEELFGHRREALVGMQIEELVPERYRDLHDGHRDRYLDAPVTRPMGAGLELAGRRADGSEFPVEISLSPIEQDGETLVITIVRDTSERSAAEARFRTLLESAPDAIMLVDSGGRIVLANRRSEELFGHAPDTLVGLGVDALVPERSGAMHAGHRSRYLSTPRTRPMGAGLELHGRRRDGTEFPVEISLSPFPSGGEMLVTTIVRDITDRKAAEAERLQLARAEAARAEAEASAARLGELMGDLEAIVWEADAASRDRFTFVGGRAEAILGYPLEAWKAPGFWQEHLHPDDRERVGLVAAAAPADGDEHELEYRLRAADGRMVWVRDIVRVVPAHGGLRLRGVMVDVTERRELESRLLQSQKMDAVGQLAGGIAHDFNNLLTVISGFASLLSARLGDHEGRSDLREIENAAERAAALTQQLLAFSRRGARSVERFDLDALVRGLEPMLRRLIDEDMAVSVTTTERPNHIEADAGQIEQAVVNLVVNARDALSSGGQLRIATSRVDLDPVAADSVGLRPGRYARVLVADTGTGMDAETQRRAFEPFFTTKPAGKGTGLGLATVYGTVDQAGGRVTVDSEPGRGTEVTLWLPAVGAPEEPAEPAAPLGTRATILLVEDEPALRRLARTLLEGLRYRVVEAGDGDAALALATRHREEIDLVLTDIVMPGLSGPDLVRHLTPLVPGIRVLYMSGYADSSLAGRGVDEQALDILHKPFRADELEARVERALA